MLRPLFIKQRIHYSAAVLLLYLGDDGVEGTVHVVVFDAAGIHQGGELRVHGQLRGGGDVVALSDGFRLRLAEDVVFLTAVVALEDAMFSTRPMTGTSRLCARFTALPTIMPTSSCGADTVTIPSTGMVWNTVRKMSEVPGGISMSM